MKRFISRRGSPKLIISDNGTSFISSEVQNFAANKINSWQFNVASAPWQGGFFERLVKSVKRCLKKILTNSRVTYEEMSTILSEIETVINNRPLTFIYNELTEQPLTPNHLIYGRQLERSNNLPNNVPNKVGVVKQYDHVNNLITHYWNRWSNEYLVGLREYRQKPYKNNRNKNIKINDVVLILNDKPPRATWKFERITKLRNSNDGHIRGATVVVHSNGRLSVLNRPVNKLIPIELSIDEEVEMMGDDEVEVEKDPVNNPVEIKFMDDDDVEMFEENVQ